MPLNVSNEAEVNLLTLITGAWGTLDVRLFSAPTTLSATTVAANFTPADYMGASTINPTWSTPATDGSGTAFTLSSSVAFPVSSGSTQTVYGWYATRASGAYVFGYQFATAITISTTVTVDPFSIKFTLRQET